ncbi:MAG: hypothetical protein A2Y76_05490 [Planctomycetes bacterium RBG_13_60_9]|nr:MAG: hypothetical protein A2Y76_05490 [Planctomycetes bacterium RBG_13_60_9]
MTTTGVRTFDQSVEITREWLQEVQEQMGLEDEQRAFRVTRAILQTLRDRLTVEEAAEFAAQLPMLLQGVFYHGWSPTGKPVKIRNRQEFLDRVAENLMREQDPEEACRVVFSVLKQKMTGGEIEDVKRILPEPIRNLWP